MAENAFTTPAPSNRAGVVKEGGTSDERLASDAAAGSLQAMETLVIRHQPKVYRFLLAKTNSRAEAEDLAQETFLVAFRKIKGFNPKYAFTTWLFTIAHRLAISAWRKHRDTTNEIPDMPEDAACPAQNAQDSDKKRNLWDHARTTLNHNQYSALWLHYAEDLSIAEIAKALHKTAPGVKLLLFRARNKLQSSFSSELL
jgi:RNA polymerase sigma-70 factor (ECF subfamily)